MNYHPPSPPIFKGVWVVTVCTRKTCPKSRDSPDPVHGMIQRAHKHMWCDYSWLRPPPKKHYMCTIRWEYTLVSCNDAKIMTPECPHVMAEPTITHTHTQSVFSFPQCFPTLFPRVLPCCSLSIFLFSPFPPPSSLTSLPPFAPSSTPVPPLLHPFFTFFSRVVPFVHSVAPRAHTHTHTRNRFSKYNLLTSTGLPENYAMTQRLIL